ncbi:MAG TPA: NAD(+) synthase [Candidatus Eisenbergiella merdigallinarum]|uniref:Glutamine-dependent NAD(+) synthetase n=1 Tax=Candidatus Eisenbergiella merdigallinarum TaxID=2838552 RepID=A0A9D2MUF5_9FIRM|nr:NAD(+) synthase [Candidatus Eisenbergiella merdigallinarum]
MKHGFVRMAAVTPKIRVADPMYNAQAVCACLDRCFEEKVKVAVLPELCLTSFTCQDLFLQERLLDGAKEALREVIAHTKGRDALVFAGLPLEKDGKLYNVAAAIQDGRLLGFVPKRNIPNYAEFYEVRHFAAGSMRAETVEFDGQEVPFGANLLFACSNVPGLTVGCEICEDVWVADPPSTGLAKAGATVIVNLSASNETVGKDDYRRELLKATSARLIAGYVYACAGEGESTQDLVFAGHNMILENGSILAEAGLFENGMVVSELDLGRLRHERRRMTTFVQEGQENYEKISFALRMEETPLTRSFAPRPFVPDDGKLRERRCEEILAIQALGLKKRYEHTGSQSAVIGVSGGLDSTLALLVTARAFDLLGMDRSRILSVTMPCFGTTDRTYENACRLARALGSALREVNIREAVRVHFGDIGQDQDRHDVTYENGQARERTQVLMDLANQTGGLVIGTGDMSELALGWATYNGDHMSMYGVNAGVPKTLVRHLVQYCADTCRDADLKEVLLDVLDTPVSPELLPPVDGVISQKTEDLVGPYELHDFFLYYMLRCGFSPAKVYRIAVRAFAGLYEEETVLKWLKTFYRRFFSQQFKRSCLPDGPKVGSVALSPRGDLRMPSDAALAVWQKELDAI